MTQTPAQSITELTQAALEELAGIESPEALEQWRVAYLGRRGGLTGILRGLSQLDLEQRREVGSLGNQAKATLEASLEQRTREISEALLARAADRERIDVTLPGRPLAAGRLHPTTQVVRRLLTPLSQWDSALLKARKLNGITTTSKS